MAYLNKMDKVIIRVSEDLEMTLQVEDVVGEDELFQLRCVRLDRIKGERIGKLEAPKTEEQLGLF